MNFEYVEAYILLVILFQSRHLHFDLIFNPILSRIWTETDNRLDIVVFFFQCMLKNMPWRSSLNLNCTKSYNLNTIYCISKYVWQHILIFLHVLLSEIQLIVIRPNTLGILKIISYDFEFTYLKLSQIGFCQNFHSLELTVLWKLL